ncbi:DNA-directed RNA polymerase subunit L [Sulfurisphaera javensis]|uniref:DNA-directed RNA polymerase subunit Rpo11 n=1 Tax=Sulfurisphaera javensis TaxID=2049879 RepID=A0AAT9GPP0_9CREN
MEIKVLKAGENYIELQIDGEEHTLGNLIKGYLMRVQGVKFASYAKPHPLIDSIIVKIMTDGSISPKEALIKAIELAEADTNKFIEEVKNIEKR